MSDEEEGGGEEGAPAWMATFSDLCTLLLTFFVLLLSFANMDVEHFKEAMGSVKNAMGVNMTVKGDFESLATDILELSNIQSGPNIPIDGFTKDAAESVKKYVKKRGLGESVEVEGTERGVVLRTRDKVLFGTGSAGLLDHGTPVLELIGDLLKGFTGELSIQGHTDSVPISSSRFPSNWELSTARATAVMRFLARRHGNDIQKRVQIAGYADTRPIVKGNDAEARARNRRVEFLFQFPVGKDGNMVRKKVFSLDEAK